MERPIISVVVPCYNEEGILADAISTIQKHLQEITTAYEVILVDDGSQDGTFAEAEKLSRQDCRVRGVRFTRNFGKEAAIHAGLREARGAAFVVMDADLQHPPELLKTFFRYWRDERYEVVEAVKQYRSKGNFISQCRSRIFNWLMNKFTGMEMYGASDYKLLDARVAQKILELEERNRFYRGLVNWAGYRTKRIPYEESDRIGGETKWSTINLIRLSVSAITSFSNIPLHLITVLGFLTLIFSLILGIQTIYNKLAGNAVSGFTTVIILNLALSSIVMISLGIIGAYLANIYMEAKKRPFYIIGEETPEDGRYQEGEKPRIPRHPDPPQGSSQGDRS